MVTTYTKDNCKVFREGTEAILVYDNDDHVQVCITSKRLEKHPYVRIPKSLCKEVGQELCTLGSTLTGVTE